MTIKNLKNVNLLRCLYTILSVVSVRLDYQKSEKCQLVSYLLRCLYTILSVVSVRLDYGETAEKSFTYLISTIVPESKRAMQTNS